METREPTVIQPASHLGEEVQQLVTAITHAVAAEKIICFGSTVHRVERKSCFPETADRPFATVSNSYALLVIPEVSTAHSGSVIQQRAEEAARSIADVVVIVHPMAAVNAALANGSAFFSAIYHGGALIYDSNEVPFVPLGHGKPIAERVAKRERFWGKWHALAIGFLQGAAFYRTAEQANLAVYMLHQAMQHCYVGVLRVAIGYRTNSQALDRLLRLIDATAAYTGLAIPRQTPDEARLAGILLKGYSDARYGDAFEVSMGDVGVLMDSVSAIIDSADQHCRKRIQQFKDGKVAYVA